MFKGNDKIALVTGGTLEQYGLSSVEGIETFSGKVAIKLSVATTKELDLGSIIDFLDVNDTINIDDSHEVDRFWSDTRTLATGANETLDLSGSLIDDVGNASVFFDIKALYIKNTSTANTLKIGGAVSNAFPLFAANSDILVLRPNTSMLFMVGDVDGLVIDTNDQLKIEHGGETAADLNYDIVIVGLSDQPTPTPTPTATPTPT